MKTAVHVRFPWRNSCYHVQRASPDGGNAAGEVVHMCQWVERVSGGRVRRSGRRQRSETGHDSEIGIGGIRNAGSQNG